MKKNAITFGYQLARLWLGVNTKQLSPKLEDHNKIYQGKKIPISTVFSLTYVCNFECAHCGADIDNAKADLDLKVDKVISLVNEMSQQGTMRIGFTGGEPLAKNEIGEIIDECHKNNMMISMTTNGWHVRKFIEYLKKLSILIISLDGTEKVHDSIRRKEGSFKRVIDAIHLAKENKIPVLVNTCVMSSNIENIDQVSQLVKELDVNWTVNAYMDNYSEKKWQKKGEISRPSNAIVQKIVDLARQTKLLCNSDEYLKFLAKTEAPKHCFAGIGYSVISPEGKLYPCLPAQYDPNCEGMDLKTMSFKDAFEKMPLYRTGCNTCDAVCHMELNNLYAFKPSAIKQAFKYLRKK